MKESTNTLCILDRNVDFNNMDDWYINITWDARTHINRKLRDIVDIHTNTNVRTLVRTLKEDYDSRT